MADVKWIKIATDIFNDEKILLIESLPEADTIITIWFKLLCLAGRQNNAGVFVMNDKIAYTDKMLATIFRRKETSVQMALKVFQDFGMIEIVDNVITIPKWDKYQKLDAYEAKKEYDRQYQAKKRLEQKQKALVVDNRTSGRTTVGMLDKEEDKELEVVLKENITKEKDEPLESKAPVLMPKDTQIALEVHDIFNYWNVCDIIVHKTINEKMVSQIEKSLKLYGADVIKKAIKNYMIVLKDSRYYFKTKWTLIEFLKQSNALPDFFDAGTKWINYLEFVKTKGQKDRPKDKYEIENQDKDPMEGMEVL